MIDFLTNIVYSFMRDSFIAKHGVTEAMQHAESVAIIVCVFFSAFVISQIINIFANIQDANNLDKLEMTPRWALLEFVLQFWVNAAYITVFVFITVKIHIVVFLILGVLELVVRILFVMSEGFESKIKNYQHRGPISWLSAWIHYGVASYQLYFMRMEEYDNKLENALKSKI